MGSGRLGKQGSYPRALPGHRAVSFLPCGLPQLGFLEQSLPFRGRSLGFRWSGAELAARRRFHSSSRCQFRPLRFILRGQPRVPDRGGRVTAGIKRAQQIQAGSRMLEGRWTTITESEYEHERRGLEAIRRRLPDEEPWRAWSNFTFTANSGHVREVDLLLTSPAGVFLAELKDWHGSVQGGGNDWVQTTPGGTHRRHGNPCTWRTEKPRNCPA